MSECRMPMSSIPRSTKKKGGGWRCKDNELCGSLSLFQIGLSEKLKFGNKTKTRCEKTSSFKTCELSVNNKPHLRVVW